MSEQEPTSTEHYRVVLNHEEQYSIWSVGRPNPAGWSDEGTVGSQQDCLDRIEQVWVDMRPLSVRNRSGSPERRR